MERLQSAWMLQYVAWQTCARVSELGGRAKQLKRYIVCGRVCWAVTVEANSHIAYRAHAVPLPCSAAKGLDCVFPI